jgi:uncharacterized protein (TIGR02301 family)
LVADNAFAAKTVASKAIAGTTSAGKVGDTGSGGGAETSGEAQSAEKPTPYDDKLTRLSEILGSLDFIRNLCAQTPETQWKAMMAQLLESDARDEPQRRAHLTAAFNRGYRSFAAMQTSCSADLRSAGDRYRIEGATLATEIAARYGN